MLGPLPELKPMARARMGYRCHGWRHLGRSTKRWRSAGIGSCRRTPLGGTRGSSALHAPDGRPEGSDGRHIDRKNRDARHQAACARNWIRHGRDIMNNGVA